MRCCTGIVVVFDDADTSALL